MHSKSILKTKLQKKIIFNSNHDDSLFFYLNVDLSYFNFSRSVTFINHLISIDKKN